MYTILFTLYTNEKPKWEWNKRLIMQPAFHFSWPIFNFYCFDAHDQKVFFGKTFGATRVAKERLSSGVGVTLLTT